MQDPAKITKRLKSMTFASVYPYYITKAHKKNRSEQEVVEIVSWLTGYSAKQLQQQRDLKVTFDVFFDQAPLLNPHVSKITGSICGYKIQEIADPLHRKVRYLDKLIDELAHGKPLEKILRQ